MARKADSAYVSTSARQPKLAVDSRPPDTGGKRKGRRLRIAARTARAEAIDVARLAELVETYGTVEVSTVKRGRKQYARMVTYVDPSRVKQ